MPTPQTPIRLDKLVAERFGLSRRAAQEAVRNGRIDLAGTLCDEPGQLVDPEATLDYHPNRPKARRVATRAVHVLFEDRYLLIVSKPPGLLTLPTPHAEHDTMLQRVSRYLTIRHGGRHYVGIVHRLDKDTSGALVLARSPQALRALQALFKVHEIERQYLAVVEGEVPRDSGTIDLPLITDRGDLRRGIAREPGTGKRAVTHYQVVERFGPLATLITCRLETGRTHQIRIHLAAIGHPVVGDPVYRPRSMPKKIKVRFPRQALHAQTLGFRHPFRDEDVRVEVPPPSDFSALLADLRRRSGRG